MADFRKMYITLVEGIDKSIEVLQTALKQAEEIYINHKD